MNIPSKTYLFYDIETTGLNKAFDQVLHFAAIRTDLELNEIERYDLKVKLNIDVVPFPEAMLIHQMKLSDIAEGVSEYEAIKKIHQWMNEPGTISLGYNTLQFDDEFLRFSFFRNLLPPYTHQYANQCGRMDIYPMAVMYYLFKKEVLAWPEIDGQISLKLEHLNQANHFVQERSHHAMVDVEATIMLAKQFMKDPKMWDYLCGYFNKNEDQSRLRKVNSETALMIWGKFGYKQLYQSQVEYLGEHAYYKNQFLFLRLDDKDFSLATNQTDIIEQTFVVKKKLGEPGFLLPFSDRHTRYLDVERLGLANANKKWLHDNPELFKQLVAYHVNYTYPEIPNVDVDASLYLGGFWNPVESNLCTEFHVANPDEKSKIIQKIKNPRLYSLAVRVLGRHFPEALSLEQADYFSQYITKLNHAEMPSIIDYKGNFRLTPSVALQRIEEMRKGLFDGNQLALLNDLAVFIC
jgi:exodeoxyribonuclease-1